MQWPCLQTLAGTISISPSDSATTGTLLTANYSGSEPGISYQWKKDNTAITSGGTSQPYTPTAAGSYTVTVSASGYASKTSDAVEVTGTAAPDPEAGLITYTQVVAYLAGV